MTKRAFLFVLLSVALLSCKKEGVHRTSRETTAMETYLSVSIYDKNLPKERANVLIDSTFAEINRVEKVMTDYADTSEVGQINVNAGAKPVLVSNELRELIGSAHEFSEQSNGAFDITVGAVVKAWDFLSSEPEIPSRSKIRMLRQLVGYRKLLMDSISVFLPERGMRIDLGGIAKGHAVNKVIEILKRNKVANAIVDLGGNLGVWWEGTHALDTAVAEILIRHPRKEGKFFGSFMMGTGGVSTSGDYQRYFIKEGVRYHHVIDPATGYSASDVVSVTIVADDAMTADALSTLVFVLGREKGMEFIKQTKGVEGVIVWEDRDSLMYTLSPGLQNKFRRTND